MKQEQKTAAAKQQIRMRLSPIIKREIELKGRNYTMPAVLLAVNTVLFTVALAGSSGIMLSVKRDYILDYSAFLRIYMLTVLLMYAMVLFSAPMYTASGISGERERGTFDLLLTTRLTAADIVLEKLVSALFSIGTLVISCLPALLVPLMFGGVHIQRTILLVLVIIAGTFMVLCIGMFASSLTDSSMKSAAIAYALTLGLTAGPPVLTWLVGRVASPGGNWAAQLMAVDPVTPVLSMLLEQAGEGRRLAVFFMSVNADPSSALVTHTVPVCLAVQAVLGLAFAAAAVIRTRPGGLRLK